MDEKGLLELWNIKRTQVINAQKAPNFMLIGIFVLAAFGKFDTASDATKYLVLGVAAALHFIPVFGPLLAPFKGEIAALAGLGGKPVFDLGYA